MKLSVLEASGLNTPELCRFRSNLTPSLLLGQAIKRESPTRYVRQTCLRDKDGLLSDSQKRPKAAIQRARRIICEIGSTNLDVAFLYS